MDNSNKDLTCIREDVDENTFIYTNCKSSLGDLDEVLFCREGIYIVLKEVPYSIRTTYRRLREILKTQYVYIYVQDKGYYDYRFDKFIDMEYELFFDETFNETYFYSDEEMKLIEDRLRAEDAATRGSFIDDKGQIYIKKGSNFRKVSDIDPNKIYYLCLFFGFLGFHRFRLKKFLSGIMYFLSAGFFGVGWIFDLSSIYFGIQTDRKKRLLLPVDNKRMKLFMLPIGIVVNAVYFRLYFSFIAGI